MVNISYNFIALSKEDKNLEKYEDFMIHEPYIFRCIGPFIEYCLRPFVKKNLPKDYNLLSELFWIYDLNEKEFKKELDNFKDKNRIISNLEFIRKTHAVGLVENKDLSKLKEAIKRLISLRKELNAFCQKEEKTNKEIKEYLGYEQWIFKPNFFEKLVEYIDTIKKDYTLFMFWH